MSYDGAILYLYNLQKYGIKLGLENISRLLGELGNPQNSFRFVHVAGTNGKGSVSVIIASMLREAGFSVGLFTSPHLVSFTERIRSNAEEITEAEVIRLVGEIREVVSRIDGFSPTFFEVVTTMALLHFKKKKSDIAVMEVGMGGRLDATNVIRPDVAVVTNIGYDHKEFLGETLGEIAREKAGIIKTGIPVVSSHQEAEAAGIILRTARERHSELFIYGEDFGAALAKADISGIHFDYKDGSFLLPDLFLPLTGDYQMQNASVAIKAARIVLRDRGGELEERDFPHTDIGSVIRKGLKNVRWPGRLEFINENPPVVIDGAHNPAAAAALAETLKKYFKNRYEGIIMVLGVMDDKDIRGVMEPLIPVASQIILTSPSYRRAASTAKLAGIAASLGATDVQCTPSLREAVDIAMRLASPANFLVLITGSFYTIGEAKEMLGVKGVLPRLRE